MSNRWHDVMIIILVFFFGPLTLLGLIRVSETVDALHAEMIARFDDADVATKAIIDRANADIGDRP